MFGSAGGVFPGRHSSVILFGTRWFCLFCLLFFGVTVVGAVVSEALPWFEGGRQRAGCLVPLQRAISV